MSMITEELSFIHIPRCPSKDTKSRFQIIYIVSFIAFNILRVLTFSPEPSAMPHSTAELSSISGPVSPTIKSEPIRFVIYKISIIEITIRVMFPTFSIFQKIFEFPLIPTTIGIIISTVTICFVTVPLSYINFVIFPSPLSITLLGSLYPRTRVYSIGCF